MLTDREIAFQATIVAGYEAGRLTEMQACKLLRVDAVEFRGIREIVIDAAVTSWVLMGRKPA